MVEYPFAYRWQHGDESPEWIVVILCPYAAAIKVNNVWELDYGAAPLDLFEQWPVTKLAVGESTTHQGVRFTRVEVSDVG